MTHQWRCTRSSRLRSVQLTMPRNPRAFASAPSAATHEQDERRHGRGKGGGTNRLEWPHPR